MDKPNVLVVDDQPSICAEVAAFLKNHYTVHAFKSAKEAMKYLDKHTVDFILLDYYMPEMTGFEMLLNLQQNESLKNTPVVFLTSEINERMQYEMLQRGAVDYLAKPINAAALINCIQKHL